jgi:3-dehydroquinate dehydratase-1
MAARKSVKTRVRGCRLVGVITTGAELRLATAMSAPPDLFELRLDHVLPILDRVESDISVLPAPVIVTARHGREGGANNLSARQREELLLRFLPYAELVDVELRSADALRAVLELARKKHVRRILSFHDLKSTPTARSLCTKAKAARRLGADIFKVATRTDTPAQLERLLDFAAHKHVDLPLGVMGIGKLGALSRRLLPRLGSVLAYAPVMKPRLQGQVSLNDLRAAIERGS